MSWVNYKSIDLESVNNKIKQCVESKHFTNGSKFVSELEISLKSIFAIDNNKDVIMVCNGANGIDAIVGGVNIYYGKKLRWVVQAFTFPCSKQGLLMDSFVVDTGDLMGPSIDELVKIIDSFDCILITNCFGCSVSINDYINFCEKYNKMLFFDNAASPLTMYESKNHLNYGNGCMVSLHHTKPIGFGEGGFIVCDNKFNQSFRKAICFGYDLHDRIHYSEYAGNHKMSEISCIYIAEYLKNIEKIYQHHIRILMYFVDELKKINNGKVEIFKNYAKYHESLMSTIPLLFDPPISIRIFLEQNIEAKKYYYPLDFGSKHTVDLYERIICLPLNLDIDERMIDKYIKIIGENIN